MPQVTIPGPSTNSAKYDLAATDSTVLQRILARVDYQGECWIWMGAQNDRGYAVTTVDGVTLYAHRLAYRVVRGPLIDGLVLDHLCRVPLCVNPMHTEQVTTAENTRRGDTNGNKHLCSKGHEYAGDNLRRWTDKLGRTRRYCIQCTNDRNKAWRAAH